MMEKYRKRVRIVVQVACSGFYTLKSVCAYASRLSGSTGRHPELSLHLRRSQESGSAQDEGDRWANAAGRQERAHLPALGEPEVNLASFRSFSLCFCFREFVVASSAFNEEETVDGIASECVLLDSNHRIAAVRQLVSDQVFTEAELVSFRDSVSFTFVH